MLSKLRYFSQRTTTTCPADLHELQSAVTRHLETSFGSASLSPIVGGTLGICFRADTADKTYFVKTHRPDEDSQENLLKEFEILQTLYGQFVHIDRFDVVVASEPRTCMLLDWFDIKLDPVTPSDLRAIIGECYEALGRMPSRRATAFSTMADLIEDGDQALLELGRLELLSAETSARIQPYLVALKNAAGGLAPVICHGDLSNKNIMQCRGRNIIIDWEDAFVGFKGYDYLYWLTFMDNRKYLSPSALGHTALDVTSERGVLLAIVAIKSLISVRSQTMRPSHVPVEQRLIELLTF